MSYFLFKTEPEKYSFDDFLRDQETVWDGVTNPTAVKYLREMPKDPFTHRTDTWIPDEGSILTTLDETAGGIDNVHSASQEVSTEGTTYNSW